MYFFMVLGYMMLGLTSYWQGVGSMNSAWISVGGSVFSFVIALVCLIKQYNLDDERGNEKK